MLISRVHPIEEHVKGSVISATKSTLRVCFEEIFPVDEGSWRLDLGRPNIVFERMRAAVKYMEHDPQQLEFATPVKSEQYILQGTHLRDVILRTFDPNHENHEHVPLQAPDDVQYPSHDVLERGIGQVENFSDMGLFKDDMRIQSWARRYARDVPLVMDGDPKFEELNASQVKAMATMIGKRLSLIQGVCLTRIMVHFYLFFFH